MPLRILIAEDEEDLQSLLRYNLEKEGFIIDNVLDGDDVMHMVSECAPDLLLLDWMLPNMSGIDICRNLRGQNKTQNLPIILLTARGEERDKVQGLDIGADDYITKPFSMVELVSRIHALLRRSQKHSNGNVISVCDVEIDVERMQVYRCKQPIKLGPLELKLLQVLMKRPGRVYGREQLLDLVWGDNLEVDERTVDVYIRRIRKALNKNAQPDLIRTIRGGGYAFLESY